MNTLSIGVIICTHNPREEFINRTVDALRQQDFPLDQWQLLIIDNSSTPPLADRLDLSWHPHARVVEESKLGLTNARLRAFAECHCEILVWSDDDNLLAPNYLSAAHEFMVQHPRVGIAGGKSIPEYESAPPSWYRQGLAPLGCRDLGDDLHITTACETPAEYPKTAAIGAGMVSRRAALGTWIEAVTVDQRRRALGRTGQALTSGEDNDMNLTAMRNGWDLAYVPDLNLTHLIPPGRLTLEYQKRIAHASFRDFVKVLDMHGIRPWPKIPGWSVPFRKMKAWFQTKAWQTPANVIRWSGLCGQYEGRAKLD